MNTSQTKTSFEENFNNKFIGQSSQKFRLIILLFFSTIIILWWWIKRRQYRLRYHGTSLLLCGLTNSGKTLLFNCLTSKNDQQTSKSTTINHGIMTLDYLSTGRPIKKVRVIDIPGHLSAYQHDLHAYKASIKGIIFVIDSTTIEKDKKYICDHLYNILNEKYFQDQHLPLLIFCNKQDISEKNQNLQYIRELLEDELTRKRQMNNNDDYIGRLGKETFEFDDIKNIRIEFVEGSVLNIGTNDEDVHDHKSNLLRVHQWIARIWFK